MNFAPSTVSALVVDKKVLVSAMFLSTYCDLGDLHSQVGSGDSDSI